MKYIPQPGSKHLKYHFRIILSNSLFLNKNAMCFRTFCVSLCLETLGHKNKHIQIVYLQYINNDANNQFTLIRCLILSFSSFATII